MKFYEMSVEQRREFLGEAFGLAAEECQAWEVAGGLGQETANNMVENVVGLYSLPVGIAQNFVINGKAVLVPMVIEEPSVVAGASFMAKLAQKGGGFRASMTAPEMIGQLQLLDLPDPTATRELILAHKDEL
ncbi:MAG: 3-hydroxy-3-methylglutaryl-CoA reductase, partial [Anaerolineaceae bacterium]|nr:3-hydroxy-3-methylglutaryl-CoA reductase [Anaerolineaceae bacterium]